MFRPLSAAGPVKDVPNHGQQPKDDHKSSSGLSGAPAEDYLNQDSRAVGEPPAGVGA